MSPFSRENVKIWLYLSLLVAFYIELATTVLPNGKHHVC